MNDLTSPDLSHLSTAELRGSLTDAARITASQVVRMAAIVAELERRGEDLAELGLGTIGIFRKIAHGQVLPELFARFNSSPLLLSRAANMPIPDQQRLADTGSLDVYEMQDGSPTKRSIPAHLLSRPQIEQIFGRDQVRGEHEQIVYARGRSAHQRTRPTKNSVHLDEKRGGLTINGVFLSRAELANYLARLSQ